MNFGLDRGGSRLQSPSALCEALQRALDRWQLFAPCPGANVTVVAPGLDAWNAASGYADADTKARMRVGGLFYVYSISKTFTAIRILQLAEQALVSLDDPVTRYFPTLAFPPAATLRALLNHTAGVPSYTDLPAYLPAVRARPSDPWPYEEVLARTCRGRLDFAPGTDWRYSNTGYMLLHRLIETLTAESFARAIERGIVRPLGLARTWAAEEVDRGRLVPGYCRDLNDAQAMENVIPRYHPGWCRTGLIVSTTEEIAQLYRALFDGRLLGAASLRAMTSWTSTGDTRLFFKRPGYGLGLMLDPDWGFGGLCGHGGDGPGYNTWSMHVADFHGGGLTLAVFCNASFGSHPFYLVKDLVRVLEDSYIDSSRGAG
jgi:D-alanyl-D-alanine carboxypeptidase